MQPNLNRFFWRQLYDGKGKAINNTKVNKVLFGEFDRSVFSKEKENRSSLNLIPKTDSFELEVAWPGLLTGLGYGHGVGGLDSEVKLGFSLDYTTGLPYLPGSTVKGWLRHFFPGRYSDSRDGIGKREEIEECMSALLKEINIKCDNLFQLENAIFEGSRVLKEGDKIQALPFVRQDIFFDAFPVEIPTNGCLLAEEYITPHPHPLQDPTPLRMLKIAPGVKFKFEFYLNDNGVPATNKKKLFEYLIQTYGIGAKTSSGFGQFVGDEWPEPTKREPLMGHGLPAAPSSKWYTDIKKALRVWPDEDITNEIEKAEDYPNRPLPDLREPVRQYSENPGPLVVLNPMMIAGSRDLEVRISILQIKKDLTYCLIDILNQNPIRVWLRRDPVSEKTMGDRVVKLIRVNKDSTGNLLITVPD